MVRFCGYELELLVDAILTRREGPSLCAAHDDRGGRWLIVQVDSDPAHLAWVCAPLSARALRAVVEGQASARDVLRHSATGTVELVTVQDGRAMADRCLLCSQLDLLFSELDAGLPAEAQQPAPLAA